MYLLLKRDTNWESAVKGSEMKRQLGRQLNCKYEGGREEADF
jgi:hypothetical protein